MNNYTHKTKGTFCGAMGAIKTYHSLSGQLELFWLLLWSHFGEMVEPERLMRCECMFICMKWYLKEPFWLQLRAIIQNGSPGDPH